ncbi:MAG: aldo/keto reductase [Propionibacteriaceae bacterium]|jgi:aryl-alcohol dehydrogenase-like predicted oxidoreductase|nr:aldo/keto reductase [Propionibacteriaceae bacterium]
MLRIGKLKVSQLCLGGNVFGWTASPETSDQILDAFTDGGGNFIDTADSYSAWVPGHSGGESERTIGVWLRRRGRHDDLVIATKVAKHPRNRGLKPSNIKVALDGSRRRLGLDTVDLYYAHADDPSLPVAEWVGAFNDLIKQGAIRHYGLSNFSVARIEEVLQTAAANGLQPPVAVQPEYNLVHRRDVEASGLLDVVASHKLAVVPYYGLAGGFLTGKYLPGEPLRGPRAATVKRYATEDGYRVVEELLAVAEAAEVEPATAALSWLRQQPGVTAPIASASSPEQVEPLLQAMTVKLGRARLNRLTRASQPFA